MIKDKAAIEIRLQELSFVINQCLQSDIDKKKLAEYWADILDLSGEVVSYLNDRNLLTLWAKAHIIAALNALNWNWFNLALSRLSFALCEENEISPTVEYSEEISRLSADEIINHIDSLKRRMKLS